VRRSTGLFALTLLLFVSLSGAEAGRTAGQTLTRISVARPAGLADAFVAVDKDIQAMNFNPAGLAKLPDPIITSTYKKDFADTKLGAIGYAHPLRFGSLFIGGGYFDAGNLIGFIGISLLMG
jgi:hypothetical protein